MWLWLPVVVWLDYVLLARCCPDVTVIPGAVVLLIRSEFTKTCVTISVVIIVSSVVRVMLGHHGWFHGGFHD